MGNRESSTDKQTGEELGNCSRQAERMPENSALPSKRERENKRYAAVQSLNCAPQVESKPVTVCRPRHNSELRARSSARWLMCVWLPAGAHCCQSVWN